AAGLPGRAPEDQRPQHLGKIQTALMRSIAPVLTSGRYFDDCQEAPVVDERGSAPFFGVARYA
ncbi:SDR family NAD(P)-dependent oxidoreductase, partial [Rhizobium sp. 16-528-1A]|nr:oxidoreductase [Rhizobium sp. 16-488-2b]MBO9177006.1 oxidoreductase [Rhizobium sp. 16-488-2a]